MTTNSTPPSLTFTPEQLMLIQNKHGEENQLTFAVMLKFFEKHGRFPVQQNVGLKQLVIDSATYLELDAELVLAMNYGWNMRSMDRFKQEIRFFLGFRMATLSDKVAFIEHCKNAIFVSAPTWDQALEEAYKYFKMKKLEPYTTKQFERFVATAHHQFEFELCENIGCFYISGRKVSQKI